MESEENWHSCINPQWSIYIIVSSLSPLKLCEIRVWGSPDNKRDSKDIQSLDNWYFYLLNLIQLKYKIVLPTQKHQSKLKLLKSFPQTKSMTSKLQDNVWN